jgi:hypothetical protein
MLTHQVAAVSSSGSSQPEAERLVLRMLPAALIVLSFAGMAVALDVRPPHPPRESFHAFSFAFFVVTVLYAALLYLGERIAIRKKAVFELKPEERYVPGSIVGGGFLLLLVILFAMALDAAPTRYSEVDRLFDLDGSHPDHRNELGCRGRTALHIGWGLAASSFVKPDLALNWNLSGVRGRWAQLSA